MWKTNTAAKESDPWNISETDPVSEWKVCLLKYLLNHSSFVWCIKRLHWKARTEEEEQNWLLLVLRCTWTHFSRIENIVPFALDIVQVWNRS